MEKPFTLSRLEEDEEMNRLMNERQLQESSTEEDPEFEVWAKQQIELSEILRRMVQRKITEITFGVKKPDADCQFCLVSGYWKGTDIPCVCRTDFGKKKEVEKDVEVFVEMKKDGGAIVTFK